MFSEWLTSDFFPDTKVKCRPLTGPQILDLQVQGFVGSSVYAAVKFAVLDWENAPLLNGKVSEKYDPSLIDQLSPDFAAWVVNEVSRRMSSVSEEERKNSESQST